MFTKREDKNETQLSFDTIGDFNWCNRFDLPDIQIQYDSVITELVDSI